MFWPFGNICCPKFALIIMIVFADQNAIFEFSCFDLKPVSYKLGVLAVKCYTCDGVCYSEPYCNCQTGVCEGQYCFTEKRPDGDKIFLRKGCGRGVIKAASCVQEKSRKTELCSCNDGDFCNNRLELMSKNGGNTSCKSCNEQSSSSNSRCSEWCKGDYCWMDGRSRECGRGSVNLAFHYSTTSLFNNKYGNQFDQGSACVKFIAGSVFVLKECVCNGNNYCNNHVQPDAALQIMEQSKSRRNLLTCFSCAGEVQDPAVPPSSCKETICVGQFCVLLLHGQTKDKGHYSLQRHAGCLNTTRPDSVALGCSQRWAMNKWETLECVCNKNFCNKDVNTAYAARGVALRFENIITFFALIIIVMVLFR